MNKINFEKIKNFTVTKEDLMKLLNVFLKRRRLFFIIFWGGILIYSFNTLYNKAYIDIQFVDSKFEKRFNVEAEISVLNRISENIDLRKANINRKIIPDYRDPFQFLVKEGGAVTEHNKEIEIKDIEPSGF